MRCFDLHCDTITKIVDSEIDFNNTDQLHVHLPGLKASNTAAQVFASFVIAAQNPETAFEKCCGHINGIHALVKHHSDHLALALDANTLERITRTAGKTAVIMSIEGATPLKGRAQTLEHFHALGVRLLTIAWDDNEFCGAVFGTPSGLTREGQTLIERCEHLGVAVDVSHASDKAFYDIARVAGKPFLASHSNARSVCPNDRNLTDEMIRILSDSGGIVGLTYGSGFISPEYYAHEKVTRKMILEGIRNGTQTMKEAHRIHHERMAHLSDADMPLLMAHVSHILNVGGEQCLALGSDFDGVDSLVETVSGVQDMEKILNAMQKKGIPSRVIEKICFHNALRFFRDVIP